MKTINVLILSEQVGAENIATIKKIDGISLFIYDDDSYLESEGLAESVEIIFGWPDVGFLKRAVNLKWLHLPSAGAETFVDKSLYAGQVVLTNSSGVFGIPIAEHLIGLMCAFAREIPLFVRNQDAHRWERVRKQREIDGSCVGVFGLGDIGREFAKRAKGLGCRILAVKRNPCEKPDYVDELYFDDAGVDYVAKNSDYLALCMPATGKTANILSRERIAMLKPSAFVMNIGRGSLIDQDALAEALSNGKLAGAGLDVFEKEPLPVDSPLWDMKNVIITPHTSGFSDKNKTRMTEIFMDNLKRYIGNKPLRNIVDMDEQY